MQTDPFQVWPFRQRSNLRRGLKRLRREGFRHVHVFETPEKVDAATIERVPLWNDKRDEHGPFDIIGDVHGCCDELEQLLADLGYEAREADEDIPVWGRRFYAPPEGRKAVFLGDLVDRGPRILDTVRLVRNMVAAGTAICVPKLVCEEKHMGSRAVVIVCRDAGTAGERFGVDTGETGIVYTRTGRRFFDDRELEEAMLARVRAAMDAAGLWDEFSTSWACLDCELMPWSAKAQELVRSQYAAVGAAARASLPAAVSALDQARERLGEDDDVVALLDRFAGRQEAIEKYVAAYQHYCWPVAGLDDLKLAPFHLLATEGKVHVDRDHVWHMDTLAKACAQYEQLLLATPYQVIDVTDADSCADGTSWWLELTSRGGEGMVVKPLHFVIHGKKGLGQPAVKCRGREYLRIIYGPNYDSPENLDRLRQRGLGAKRSLALREFALGIESLERFVRREPLRRVHECVFGVLAMESEPVDPRL